MVDAIAIGIDTLITAPPAARLLLRPRIADTPISISIAALIF
jgi:hypothetical protein